jgi:hypothetical protein
MVAAVTEPALANVDGVQALPVEEPAPRASRRNLFAFTEVAETVRPRIVQTAEPQRVEQQPQVVQNTEVAAHPREPEFPMRFIGTFGEAKDPIAVFEANGDVVNAKIGERVTGEFRLASIGIESVEVSTGRGTTQRVELRK